MFGYGYWGQTPFGSEPDQGVPRPLAANIASTSTLTANLGVADALFAAILSVSTASANLTVAQALAAAIASSSTLTAALGEAIGLAAAVQSTSTLSADLHVAEGLAATIVSTSTLGANLDQGQPRNKWEGAGAHWLREDQIKAFADEEALAALLAIALRGRMKRRGRAVAMTAGAAARQAAKRKELQPR